MLVEKINRNKTAIEWQRIGPNRQANLTVYCPKIGSYIQVLPWNFSCRAYDICPYCGYIPSQPVDNQHLYLSRGRELS